MYGSVYAKIKGMHTPHMNVLQEQSVRRARTDSGLQYLWRRREVGREEMTPLGAHRGSRCSDEVTFLSGKRWDRRGDLQMLAELEGSNGAS